MDLSNAFDTLDHSLIIVKLEAYGFDCLSLTFIKIHLTNRKQICKVGNRCSIWRAITACVSQGLILGPWFLTSSQTNYFNWLKIRILTTRASFLVKKAFDQVINNLQTNFRTLKGTVMQTEKALINDCSRVSKVSWKFLIPTIYNFAVIYPWNLLFS